MAKKTYMSPALLPGRLSGANPIIDIGESQGTSGYESPYTFEEGFPQDIQDLIELNADDFDLQDMDTSGDFVISFSEWEAWLDANHPWWAE